MSSKFGAAIAGGLVGGVVFGMMMHMMTALVRRGTWTSDELDTLEAAIEAARGHARQARSEP